MKKYRLILTLIIPLILASSINLANSQSEYEITGVVTYKNSNLVRDIKVEILDGDQVIANDKTNPEGYYKIKSQLSDDSEYLLKISGRRIQEQVINFITSEREIRIDITVNQNPIVKIDDPGNAYYNDPIDFSSLGTEDPDGDPITYSWNFGDGETSDLENPTYSYNQPGKYTVSLVVEDTDGASVYKQISIEIENRPPVANHNGPYTARVGAKVNFISEGSYDPEEEPLSYYWDFGDNTQSEEPNPSHIYQEKGEYKVKLTVRDIYGAEEKAETQCEVKENQAPIANANGPYAGYNGYPIEFSSEGSSDPDGEIVEYYWEFEGGQQSYNNSPTILFQETGSYVVSLTVTDINGAIDTDTTSCIIEVPPPLPPIAACNGPYLGKTGSIVNFFSTGSYDPDGGLLEYFWRFGDGKNSTEANPIHIYLEPGIYTVSLTVLDQDLETDIDTTLSTVEKPPQVISLPDEPNQSPVAIGVIPSIGEIGQIIQLISEDSYDPDGEIVDYLWNFGDNHITNEKNPTHIYNVSGTFVITLKVYDEKGKTDTYSTNISISNSNIPPVIVITGPYTGKTQVPQQYNSSESYDLDGDIVSYFWNFGDNGTSYLDNPWYNYSSPGIYNITIRITDNHGVSSNITSTVLILDNVIPTPIIAGPSETKTGKLVEFSATDSYDVDGNIIEYRWDLGDGTTSHLIQKSHIFLTEGEYVISLTITDDNQITNEVNKTILVSQNIPPKINVNASRVGLPFQELIFISESIDVDGEIISTMWEFGDREIGEGTEVSHFYNTPGKYFGRIVVTDNNHDSSTEIIEIIINEPPEETIFPFMTVSVTFVIAAGFWFRKPWFKLLDRMSKR